MRCEKNSWNSRVDLDEEHNRMKKTIVNKLLYSYFILCLFKKWFKQLGYFLTHCSALEFDGVYKNVEDGMLFDEKDEFQNEQN